MIYPICGDGLRSIQDGEEERFFAGTRGSCKQLAHDPDPATAKALLKATAGKNWKVRAAALEALAQRGDPSIVPQIVPALDDSKDDVRFSAAACVTHLSELPEKESPAEPAKP